MNALPNLALPALLVLALAYSPLHGAGRAAPSRTGAPTPHGASYPPPPPPPPDNPDRPLAPGGASGPTGVGPTTPAGGGAIGAGPAGAPGVPAPPALAGPRTAGTGTLADLSGWRTWWEYNKASYLRLSEHVRSQGPRTVGSDEFFLGHGAQRDLEPLAPTRQQIDQVVVPALLRALEEESDQNVVSSCLVALAKIGDAKGTSGPSPFEPVLAGFLDHPNQEIAETATIGLGILGNPRGVRYLEPLALDSTLGRTLVGGRRVDERTRAFAAYGLGLLGAVSEDASVRLGIVRVLARAFESDDGRARELRVACVSAMGLVPLGPPSPDVSGSEGVPRTIEAQLDWLLECLGDRRQDTLVRSHCPAALARLLEAAPDEVRTLRRGDVVGRLLEVLERSSGDPDEVQRGAVLALGVLGTCGGDPLDARVRATLVGIEGRVRDVQARHFALVSLARLGGNAPAGGEEDARAEVARALLVRLAEPGAPTRAWAALACGILGHELLSAPSETRRVEGLRSAVRLALLGEKNPEVRGALYVAAGLLGDLEARAELAGTLESSGTEYVRGLAAVGLGLMDSYESIEAIRAVVEDSRYRPELLGQAAVALGILGDKKLVPRLVALLGEASGLATQSALAAALGWIGDRRSVDPLVAMLLDRDLTPRARGYAAAALGIVADRADLPWNARLGRDCNYPEGPPTLVDPFGSAGVLDLF